MHGQVGIIVNHHELLQAGRWLIMLLAGQRLIMLLFMNCRLRGGIKTITGQTHHNYGIILQADGLYLKEQLDITHVSQCRQNGQAVLSNIDWVIIVRIILIRMENYFTFTQLLGLRDAEGANLPIFKDARVSRYRSVEKILELLQIAGQTRPFVPSVVTTLNPLDPEWDDKMPFPVIDRNRYWAYAGGISSLLFFYSYNYNIFSTNIRYRTFRNVFPFLVAYIFADAYSSYRKQILKTNLFDEYCYLRSQELVKQNEYMLDHPSVKKAIWWNQDFKETLGKVYRQANDNSASDYKDSELLLQDFVNRYVDPSAASPLANLARLA